MSKNNKGFSVVEALIVVVVLVMVGVATLFVLKKRSDNSSVAVNEAITTPKQFIQHDFIDIANIFSLSKFRSAEGHDFSDGSETCRSMKHYYNQQMDLSVSAAIKANNGMPPKPDGKTDVPIYSPVDGIITSIVGERMPIGEQFYIVPDNAKDYTIRLFHVYKVDGVRDGVHITAGQKIGVIAKGQNTDISVETKKHYVSYFSVMPDSIFATYQARGVKSRDDLILSKDYRDAHPVPCNQQKEGDQKFYPAADYDHDNDVFKLSGYIDPKTLNLTQQQYNKN